MNRIRISAISLLFIALTVVSPAHGNSTRHGQPEVNFSYLYAEKFIRTELYFGFGKPDGSEVTAEEWAKFLADEVTPRFPSGFTVLDALGQYRGDNGVIVKEKSRVLVLLHPKKDRKVNDAKIEEIRAAYKKAFQQESVMRVDIVKSVSVSFG